MKTFRSDNLVSLTIHLVDNLGVQLDPTSITYKIENESGVAVLGSTQVEFSVGDQSVSILIPAELNHLTTGKLKSLRVVELMLVADDTSVDFIKSTYVITAAEDLALMVNTYQTLNEAKLLMIDMLDAVAIKGASDADMTSAMMMAFERIGRLTFNFGGQNGIAYDQTRDVDVSGVVGYRSGSFLNFMSLVEFQSLPPELAVSIKKAQICEADCILGDNPVARKRADGVVSEKIGESTFGFNAENPFLWLWTKGHSAT